MKIARSVASSTNRSVWLRRIDPASKETSAWQCLALKEIGDAAARETLMTATPHMASIWTDLFKSILAPGIQLRWKDDGPGLGRDAKAAYSGLLGRYLARTYLTSFEGVRVMVPLDIAKRWFENTQFEIRKTQSSNGLEADWIGLDKKGLVIIEAKGSHNQAKAAWEGPKAVPSVLTSAIGQVQRTALFLRASNQQLPSKRWAIACRWGTEMNQRDPTLIAWDPDEEKLDKETYRELERILMQADLQAVAAGMLYASGVGAFGAVENNVRVLQIEQGSGFVLRVGDRKVEHGLLVAIGPFGIFPIRTAHDQMRVKLLLKFSPNIALASLATGYIQSVQDLTLSEAAPLALEDKITPEESLTVIWPKAEERIHFEM